MVGGPLMECPMLKQGSTDCVAGVRGMTDLCLFWGGAGPDNAHTDWLFVLQREVDQTLVNDSAHYIAVQGLPFMNQSQDDDYVYGGLLEEMFGY